MTDFDFDKITNRRDTGSLKWDIYKDSDIIPMWVADMDFQTPTVVIEALRKRIEHGIFGYSSPTEELNEIVVRRLEKLYNWQIKPSLIVWLPGLVVGLDIISMYVREDELETAANICMENDIIVLTIKIPRLFAGK